MTTTEKCPNCGSAVPSCAPSGICPKCLIKAGLNSQDFAESASVDSLEPTSAPQSTGGDARDAFAISPNDLAPLFPTLELVELLGQGGMGTVYKARQIKLDRDVALKIIRPESRETQGFAERFEREARALARLSHPNIVGVYDFGSVNQTETESGGELYFLLMEFVEGVNLRQLIANGSLDSSQSLAIVPQICDALQFAHDAGVVHRDIKPENILLDTSGRVKIADFGLAKVTTEKPSEYNLTGTNQVMGTPRYMAPEQLEQTRTVDHRADIYSLGVVFYEMLTGELPIGQFELPSQKLRVDVRLDEIVLKSLAKEPERRYQLASEFKTDVDSVSNGDLENVSLIDQSAAFHSVSRVSAWLSLFCWLSIPGAFVTLGLAFVPQFVPVPQGRPDLSGSFLAIVAFLIAAPAFFQVVVLVPTMLIGASRMSNLQSRPLAIATSVFALLPLNISSLMGIPIGVWSLITLMRSDVKQAFENQVVSPEQTRRQIRLAGRWLWILGLLGLLAWSTFCITALIQLLVAPEGAPSFLIALALLIVGFALYGLQIGGANKLYHLTSMVGGIVSAVLACLILFPVGLPVAIYTLAVLFQKTRGVKSNSVLFGESSVQETGKPLGISAVTKFRWVRFRWLIMSALLLVIAFFLQSRFTGWPNFESITNQRSQNPQIDSLMAAAEEGSLSQVKNMLDAGLSINDKDAAGRTPLMAAAANGHSALCQTLLLYGANAYDQDDLGKTALMHAVENGRSNVVNAIREMRTVHDVDDAKKLQLEADSLNSFDPKTTFDFDDFDDSLAQNAQDIDGKTALMMAIENGDMACVHAFLEGYPAETTLRDKDGNTALMHAVLSGQTGLIREATNEFKQSLIGGGWNRTYFHSFKGVGGSTSPLVGLDSLRLMDKNGRTALQIAKLQEPKEIYELLNGQLEVIISKSTEVIKEGENLEQMYLVRGAAYEALGEKEKADNDLRGALNLGRSATSNQY